MDKFREPTAEEAVATTALVGHRINIWWDGDNAFYPCKIVAFNEEDKMHLVKYDNDEEGPLSPELLSKQPWKIWNGSDEEFDAYNEAQQQVGMHSSNRKN